MSIDKTKLSKVENVYPLKVTPYEQYMGDFKNPSVVTKLNAMINTLHQMGRLTNETVSQWNSVMKWVLGDGLESLTSESVEKEVKLLLDSGIFNELVNTEIDIMQKEVTSILSDYSKQISNKVGGNIKADLSNLSDEVLRSITGNVPINFLSTPKDNSVESYHTTFLKVGINHFNRNDPRNKLGVFYSAGGNEIQHPTWGISHPIVVNSGEKWTIKHGEPSTVKYYKSDGTFLDVFGTPNSTVVEPYTFIVPSDAKSMEVNLYGLTNLTSTELMIVKGETYPTVFSPYLTTIPEMSLTEKQKNEIKPLVNSLKITENNLSNLTTIIKTANELDISKYEYGYFLANTTGKKVELEGFATSPHIPVKLNDVVRFYYDSSLGANNVVVAFDVNGNFVKSLTSEYPNGYKEVVIDNPLISSIRMSNRVTKLTESMLTINQPYPSSYVKHNKTIKFNNEFVLNETQKESLNASKLYGKKVLWNGDSISQGLETDETVSSYAKIISNRNQMTYKNVSVSGGTITAEQYTASGSARHWVSRSVSNQSNDVDYVIYEGGVNDASLGVNKGTISSDYTSALDDTTFCGAFESMCKQLSTHFEGKKVGFILVHKMTIEKQEEYVPLMIQMLKKWGIPYCDLYNECAPIRYIESLKTKYTRNADGWHLNRLGYEKFYCDKIESFMKTL